MVMRTERSTFPSAGAPGQANTHKAYTDCARDWTFIRAAGQRALTFGW